MCDRCGENPAVIHLTRISEMGRSELHLCMKCATGVVKLNQQKKQAKNTIDETFARHMPASVSQKRCEGCGYTAEDIRKTGRMGCAMCYQTFAELIEPALKTLRRTAGTMPGMNETEKPPQDERNKAKIRELREQMQRAVGREEYETAASLRDQIKALETK